MKNKFLFIINSLKQSIVNKPIVFVLLILIYFGMTCCLSIPSRWNASDVGRVYAMEAHLNFEIKLSKFLKHKDAIFNCFEKKEKELNAYDKMGFSIVLTQYNCDIKIKGVDTKMDRLGILLTEFKAEELVDNKNVCKVGEREAKEYGIAEGDILQLYGIDFVVSKIKVGTTGIWIPYDTEIQNWYSFESPPEMYSGKTSLSRVYGGADGISRKDLNNLYWQLMKFGCKRDNTSIVPLFVHYGYILALLAIGMVSSSSILYYWLKCNGKKYATYKTLGCSPTMLAVAMLVETLLVAVFAIGLGVLFDYILSIVMIEKIIITGYEWLHYLVLIVAPLISILIVTITAVCKRAVTMPANNKYTM